MRRFGWVVFGLGLLLGLAASVNAQGLRNGEETISVSSTTVGVTTDLCGTGNTDGAYIQVLTNGIYLCLNVGCTADSGDFRIDAGVAGPQLWVKPASRIRMIRVSSDSNVKVACTE